MRQPPMIKPLPVPIRRPLLSGTRAWLLVLGLIALVLLGLIARETVLARPAAATVRLATAATGTVKATVSGTGSLVPSSQSNVNFRVAGLLTEIDVKVGDSVKTGQVLARIDSTSQQAAVNQAQANLASAQASLQAAQTPLTGAQVAQLRDALTAAQQNYTDMVASVNAQNTADANAVAADHARLIADGCSTGTPAASCPQDQASLSSDLSKQNMDAISGSSRVHAASAQVTSAQDNYTVQTQAKPNQVSSAQAQVASAQAQLQAAQLTLNETTLTAPRDGVVVSLNGEVGEMASAGGGATAQAPGTTAPQPSSGSGTSSGSATGFIVLQDSSSFIAVIPFAETDAARLKANQDVSMTFDAVSGLTISGHVLSVSPSATVVSNVVNYYVTFVLNHTDPRLKSGMTVNAIVTAAQVDNVVYVPSAAIHTTGGTAMVTVYVGGQQIPTEVELGLVGDTTTEIKGGLKAGDQLVLPSLRTTTTTTSGGGLFGGGGVRVPGGGGGFRGGG